MALLAALLLLLVQACTPGAFAEGPAASAAAMPAAMRGQALRPTTDSTAKHDAAKHDAVAVKKRHVALWKKRHAKRRHAKAKMACDSWAGAFCKSLPSGVMQLTCTKDGGGAMQVPGYYLHGEWSMDIKLPAGNSGGIATTFYVMDSITGSNKDPKHSEIDIEFYGNTTGNPAMFTTNIWSGGKQNLAQFHLPFDASAAFHNYKIRWNGHLIVWFVDGTPIRIVRRQAGGPWPTSAMKPQSSIWATPWTKLQADFSRGPITASMRNFASKGCPATDKQLNARPVQCMGPWNRPLSAKQLAGYAKLHKASLVVEYGWDKA